MVGISRWCVPWRKFSERSGYEPFGIGCQHLAAAVPLVLCARAFDRRRDGSSLDQLGQPHHHKRIDHVSWDGEPLARCSSHVLSLPAPLAKIESSHPS